VLKPLGINHTTDRGGRPVGIVARDAKMTFRYSDRIAPVLANCRVYCRNQNGFIVCLDVGKK